jgi:manganese transport protein
MLPALVIIAMKFDPTRTLVLSQVVLSFGIPFALIPLVMFTRREDLMGTLVNRKMTTLVASFVALIIVGLNLYLLFDVFKGVVS